MNVRVVSALVLALLVAACGPLGDNDEDEVARDIELGEELYFQHCETCHGGETGGHIEDVPPPHNEHGHTWHHGDCQNLEMVMDGTSEVHEQMLIDQGIPEEDAVMPAFEGTLSEDEAMAILNFISTWWTDEQREHQERITGDLC